MNNKEEVEQHLKEASKLPTWEELYNARKRGVSRISSFKVLADDEVCAECGGTGRLPDGSICPVCHGKGILSLDDSGDE